MNHLTGFRLQFIIGMLWLACMSLAQAGVASAPVELRCEYLVNPLGIDTFQPRLSWRTEPGGRDERQTAYSIIAATIPEKLREGEADLWKSGRVESDKSLQVAYEGKELKSGQRAYWAVQTWDKDGKPSGYSTPAWFEMGILGASGWKAKWITSAAELATGTAEQRTHKPAPMFRRDFKLSSKPVRARAYICGLGYYELSINGKKVGDHFLEPAYTRFDKRSLYVTHDVTADLRAGDNTIGVMLGTGWYDVHTLAVWDFERAPWRGAPRLLLQVEVELEDGTQQTIVSDESWKTASGPITFDSIYEGETYDARLEKSGWDSPAYDASDWKHAQAIDAPTTNVVAQQMPPIRIIKRMKPARVSEPKPGVFLFDMGQNMTGVPELLVSGPAGTSVTMTCGEQLGPDGTLDQQDIDVYVKKRDPKQRFQSDIYTLKGTGEERWHPRFTYHGFQYVQVTGFPGKPTLDNLAGLLMHTDLERVGEFECDNPYLNRILEAARWAYLGNFFGIPTDCPTREKNGWTGDAHLAIDLAIYNYLGAAAYTKWLNDIADAQRDAGDLPGIVPSGGWGYTKDIGPAWDSVYLLIPWAMYRYYGDVRILETHYDGMRRYVDWMTSQTGEDRIIRFGLSDWVPWKTTTPNTVTGTGYYYADSVILSKAAELLGKSADAEKYRVLAADIKKNFNRELVNPETGVVANGSQCAQACAIYQGLVDRDLKAKVLHKLVESIEKADFHFDCGILGSKYIPNVLADNGRADVAEALASQRSQPSFGWWLDKGATTLWEQWDGTASRNHIMFGEIVAWFYRVIAGIDQEPDSVGFKRIVIRPRPVGSLTYAKASHRSPYGVISSEWQKAPFELRVTIPPNTTAKVYFMTSNPASIYESGSPAPGAKSAGEHESVVEVGSGTYEFKIVK